MQCINWRGYIDVLVCCFDYHCTRLIWITRFSTIMICLKPNPIFLTTIATVASIILKIACRLRVTLIFQSYHLKLSLSYLLATAMCILYNVPEYSIDVAQFCKVITTYQSKTYHNFWRIYFWQIEEHLLVVLLNAHNTYTQDGLYWLVYFKLEYLSSP